METKHISHGTFEVVSPIREVLGESPVWDKETSSLFWVNVVGKELYRYHTKLGKLSKFELPQCISSITLKTNEEAIITLEDGYYRFNLVTEELQLIQHVEQELTDNRFNDGKCDARGRFFAGTMSKRMIHDQAALYCLHNDFTVEQKLQSMTLSNGIAWTKDSSYMYLIDTLKHAVYQFDYNIDHAQLTNQKVAIDFQHEEGVPDGMTIDEEGMLWIAHWGGAKISRWNPTTSTKLSEISIPALNVTSCTFGGDKLDELYITTALDNMTEEQLEQYPLSGQTLKLKMDIRGQETNRFREI